MDKSNYNVNDDDEYRIQEPEPTTHFSTTGKSVESNMFFERIKRQHIVLAFIFIFLIFGTYKLLSGFFHIVNKRHVTEKIQKAAPNMDLAKSALETKTVADNRLDHLAQGQVELQSALQSLDSQLSSMQTTLVNLSSQLTQVNDEVQSLHAAQETLIQNQTKPVKKITVNKKEVPKTIYYVRAIIPGRAWVTTQEGSTLTLGVSDKVAGYGIVDAINPEQGTVTFNSGAIIGYSPDDR